MLGHLLSSTILRIKVQSILALLLVFLLASPQTSLAASLQTTIPVGLVTEVVAGTDTFSKMAFEAMGQAVTDGLIIASYYNPSNVADFTFSKGLDNCVMEGNVLCISVGFTAAEATMNAAKANLGTNFVVIDTSWGSSDYPTNLRGTYFAVQEAAYIAGTLAGLMTTSNRIGVVGGMSISPINDFILPYVYGAQWANHEVIAFVDYANDFVDATLGANIAQDQINRGADVIYGVGGSMGNGAINTAAKAGKYVVGVDTDQYVDAFGNGSVLGSEYVLTSILKKVDVAVYSTILDQVGGNFTSGTKVYNLNNGGVGLAPHHSSLPSIPSEVLNQLNVIVDGIKAGTIDVWQPFFTNSIFLPMIVK